MSRLRGFSFFGVSDCRLQVQLTQQAKIPSNLSSFEGIFAFAGFVSGLSRLRGFSFFGGLSTLPGQLHIVYGAVNLELLSTQTMFYKSIKYGE